MGTSKAQAIAVGIDRNDAAKPTVRPGRRRRRYRATFGETKGHRGRPSVACKLPVHLRIFVIGNVKEGGLASARGMATHPLVRTPALDSSGELHAIYESAGSTWYERWTKLANQADEMPSDKRIALFLRALGVSRKFTMKPYEEKIFHRLQGIILATPGHADHFAKIINDSFERG